MVKIRLSRHGKTNDPAYRVVAIDSHAKLNGKALAILGNWHPRTKEMKIDKKGIEEWVAKGAQVSPAVAKLVAAK